MTGFVCSTQGGDVAPHFDALDHAAEKHRWTGERIARLGFLVGLGWDAKRIGKDPIVRAHTNNVHRQVQRFGLSFIAARVAIAVRLPPDSSQHFEEAATKRGLSRDALIRLLLLEIASDQNLIDNILDDWG